MAKIDMGLYRVVFPGYGTYYVRGDGPVIAFNLAWVQVCKEYSEMGGDHALEIADVQISRLVSETDII